MKYKHKQMLTGGAIALLVAAFNLQAFTDFALKIRGQA